MAFFQYKLDDIVRTEMTEFFKTMVKDRLEFPDEYNTRNFVHLYDFQKFFLHKSVERLFDFIEIKIEHEWIKYMHANAKDLGK